MNTQEVNTVVSSGLSRVVPFQVLKIKGSPAEKDYRGAGRAWAAIKDGQVIALKYMSDNSIQEYERIEKPDRRFKTGVRVSFKRRDTAEEFGAFRESARATLAKLGEVHGGMCSCYEFVVY